LSSKEKANRPIRLSLSKGTVLASFQRRTYEYRTGLARPGKYGGLLNLQSATVETRKGDRRSEDRAEVFI
jgi:hypothetical protein